jgi:ribosome-binding protein aMBF1 (putative translation factor)
MTQRENVLQSLDRGTFSFAPKVYKVPPSEHSLIRMAHAYRGVSASSLAEKYGVSKSLIQKIIYCKVN